MNFNPILDKDYPLHTANDGWPESQHRFEPEQVYAIQAAIACQRPLLVRGEPGIGKSQLARAAAAVMGLPFLSFTMTAQTECGELLYEYDAVARLAQAQVLDHVGGADWRKHLALRNFVKPGRFWWALNWQHAQAQCTHFAGDQVGELNPRQPANWEQKNGAVLLVDEMDKAEGDVPNALLESFGAFTFDVPEVPCRVALPADQAPPLVIITTNEERELPRAFVRRCLVLQMDFSEELLIKRGKVHFGGRIAKAVYAAAAAQLLQDRDAATAYGPVKPGVAEYLDLLRILAASDGEQAQLQRLAQVRNFVGAKNPGQHRHEAATP